MTRGRIAAPAWARVCLGVVGTTALVFLIAPLLLALVGGALYGDFRVYWSVGPDALILATGPVHDFLDSQAVGLPSTGDALWRAWYSVTFASLMAGFTGTRAARTAWLVLGLGTAGMVWAGAPERLQVAYLVGTAVWWSVGALLIRRRTGRIRRWIRALRRPETAGYPTDDRELIVMAADRSRPH